MIILDKFLSLIAPFECIICGIEEDLLCSVCLRNFNTESVYCLNCRQQLNGIDCCSVQCKNHTTNRLYSVSSYTGITKEIVLCLKSSGMVGIASLMAIMMAKNIPKNSNLIITHIPTASRRVRSRGFDQSALLAREISKITKMPNIKLLLKNNQSRQVGSSKSQRLKNIQTAFRVQNTKFIKGANILLVDDVLTTGVTVETASRELLRAGAKSVDVVVFAVA